MITEMTLGNWLSYLTTLHPKAIELTLDRMDLIASKLGLRAFTAKVVTVAGTNGKGSVIKTLEQVYMQAGYAVAAYTSPHLMHFTERLHINNSPLPEEDWVEAFAEVNRVRGDTALTFFEFTTLAALWLCKQRALDVMLLEVGLGGRSDAVNIVESDLAVVTNVHIDHIEWLGDNREAIGYEKAGIFRAGKPAVCGDPNPPLSLLQVAEQLKIDLYCNGKQYMSVENENSWEFCGPDQRYLDLPLPGLLIQNVATALMVVELLGLPVAQSTLQYALGSLSVAGRYETIKDARAKFILDVAHNPQATQLLADRLSKESRIGKCYAILGVRKEKDLSKMLPPLLPLVDHWYTATIDTSFALDAKKISAQLATHSIKSETCATVTTALESILKIAKPEDIVLIFGSFYTVAEAKLVLQPAYS